ncbi:unnamed protein product, partial [Ectocarpus fasciculatus]
SIGAAVSAASGLPCRGAVEINGLATRGEGVATAGTTEAAPRVLKVKVGGIAGPSEDAARTVQLLRESGSSGSSSRSSTLRLDANQAWTMDEALQFSAALGAAAGRRNRGPPGREGCSGSSDRTRG